MNAANLFVSVMMVAAVAPAAGAVPADSYAANYDRYLDLAKRNGWPVTSELFAQVSEAARLTSAVDVGALHSATQAEPRGIYIGEVWVECVNGFIAGVLCGAWNDIPSLSHECDAIPLHWAAYAWVGNSAMSTLTFASAGAAHVYTWTESHAGLGPLVRPTSGGTMTGSVCYHNNGFIILLQGDGIYQEA